jgi:hypothetical protein
MHSFICLLKIEFLDQIINNLKIRIKKSINKLQEFFFTYTVDLAKEAKWFVIMLSESVLQCTNGMGTNPTEERTKCMNPWERKEQNISQLKIKVKFLFLVTVETLDGGGQYCQIESLKHYD